MTELPPPAAPPVKKKTASIAVITAVAVTAIIGVGTAAFFIGTNSGSPTTTTTTTTINPVLDAMGNAVSRCDASAFYTKGQIVFSLDEYASYTDLSTLNCVAKELMSAGTYAQWGSTTAMSGLQQVVENGLEYKFSYNGVSETSFLSIQPEG